MGDEPNLIDQFESSSNQGPTFYDYIEYGGKNQKDDKPVTYGTIKKPSKLQNLLRVKFPFPIQVKLPLLMQMKISLQMQVKINLLL